MWEAIRGEPLLFAVFLAALGAIAGSFSSAAIHRLPLEGVSLTRPKRSFCPSCRAQLRWFDNLPVVSWLALRGKCRHCGVRIPALYLLNELFLAAVFVLAGTLTWAAGEGPLALALLLVTLTALWIATVIDWQHFILPDEITIGGIPFAIVASLLVPRFHWWDPAELPFGLATLGFTAASSPLAVAGASALLGAASAFLLLIGIRALFSYLLGQEALGLGDVKYMTAVGALVGMEGAAWTLMMGVMAGALLGVVNILRMVAKVHRHRASRGKQGFRLSLYLGWQKGRLIPFGPALVLGTTAVLVAPLSVRGFFLDTWPQLFQFWLR